MCYLFEVGDSQGNCASNGDAGFLYWETNSTHLLPEPALAEAFP